MTVSYNTKVTDAGLLTFVRLFFRWKGSVWKAVWKELVLWLALYFLLNLSYRHVMTNSQRVLFEGVCTFLKSYSDFVPLTFMLGFFVNLVVNRWWTMWENIGWIDTTALYVNGFIGANDEMSRMFRRNIIRYILFFQVLVFRDISTPIRKRFPTLETLIVAGYVTEQELEDYHNTPTTYKNYYTPIRWAMNLVRQARAANRITNDYAVAELFRIIIAFRTNMGALLTYDFQPIPLIYTVVVCLSVRLFFVSALLSRQILKGSNQIDTYVPMMTIVQFIFYMGWMKVAEALLNPFGDDDDDFECNWLLDRNFEVGYIIADQNHDRQLVKDKHWNTLNPDPLYSIDTVNAEVHPLVGSAVRRASVHTKHDKKASVISQPSFSDVIMIARAPQNLNEDATSACSNVPSICSADTQKIQVRRPSRIINPENLANGGGTILGNARRKFSYLTNGKPSHGLYDYGGSETGSIGSPTIQNEEYIFMRRNTIRNSEDNRRHFPSTIREESDDRSDSESSRDSAKKKGRVNEAIDLVDELKDSGGANNRATSQGESEPQHEKRNTATPRSSVVDKKEVGAKRPPNEEDAGEKNK